MTKRMDNVVDKAVEMLIHILLEGIMRDGLLPFERPITEELVDRATVEQVDVLAETAESPSEMGDLMEKIR